MSRMLDDNRYPAVYAKLLALAAQNGVDVRKQDPEDKEHGKLLGTWGRIGKDGGPVVYTAVKSPTVLAHELGHELYYKSLSGKLNDVAGRAGNLLIKLIGSDRLSRWCTKNKERGANAHGLELLHAVGAPEDLLGYAEGDYAKYIDTL